MKTALLPVVLLVMMIPVTMIEGRQNYGRPPLRRGEREGKRRPHREEYECEVCERIVDNFRKGLERTKKYTYADKKGETRFVEIYDQLCNGAHEQDGCPGLLEEYEELIEKFWFSDEFENDADVFRHFFCVENVKACCPKGTWGQDCKDCTGGKERPCLGNGRCDGDGWRVGNGLCACHPGYKGSMCENCQEQYYEAERNETHTVCKQCHKSCRTTCTGDGPKNCYDCADGWRFVRDKGCRDINECLAKPCDTTEYCANNQGSFICRLCDPACESCYGRGHAKCRNCSEGYLKNNTECLDIDECRSDGHEELCKKTGEMCKNVPGSHVCICKPGFVKAPSGDCVPEKKEEPPKKKKKPKTDKKVPPCSACHELVNNFKQGLERTNQKHYEGGNSHWEESRLGKYPNSELRLVEATDQLCQGASKECPQILEDYEEVIEDFWFKSGLKKDAESFYKYFCIDTVKACCPNNTFGPNCTECNGGALRPCKGNGECDGGGTREGTGACNCSLGYQGELCDSCVEGFYQTLSNDTHTECTACHESCQNCTGPGPKACGECKEGWYETKDKECRACHESCKTCTGDGRQDCSACKEGYYYSEADFACKMCHQSCHNCTAEGPNGCGLCKEGWLYDDGCRDLNECEDLKGDEKPCTGEGEQCENTQGSYTCICQEGYAKDKDDVCVKQQKSETVTTEKDSGKTNSATPNPKDDQTKSDGDGSAEKPSKAGKDSKGDSAAQTIKESSGGQKESSSKTSQESAKGSDEHKEL